MERLNCEAFDREEPALYVPPPFRNTRPIVAGHEGLPRFGHPSDISLLVSGTKEQGGDYLVGLLTTSISIFSFCIAWMAALTVWYCLGYERTGLLSGSGGCNPSPQQQKANDDCDEGKPSSNEDEKESLHVEDACIPEDAIFGKDNEAEGPPTTECPLSETESGAEISGVADSRRLTRMRVCLLVSGVIVVVSAILMTTFGVDSLSKSLESVRQSLISAKFLSLEAVSIIDSFVLQQEEVMKQSTLFSVKLNTFCPNATESICESLRPTRNCSFEGIPAEVLQNVTDLLNFDKYIVGASFLWELFSFRSDLIDLTVWIDKRVSTLNNFDWAFWLASALSLTLAALTIVLMYGTISLWHREMGEQKKCSYWIANVARKFVVLPLYVFLVITSWIFSMVFVIGAAITADFCFNSPDFHVLAYLDKHSDSFNALAFDFGKFFFGGCTSTTVLIEIQEAFDRINRLLLLVNNLGTGLVDSSEQIYLVCGKSLDAVVDLGLVLERQSCIFGSLLWDVHDFFECSKFRPVYEKAVHDAICYDSTKGFSWIAMTQILIVFFSMVMLTVRAGFARPETESGAESQKQVPGPDENMR